MTLIRVLVLAILICSASAFAQNQTDPVSGSAPNANQQASEPWKLELTQPTSNAAKSPLDLMQLDQFRVDPKAAPFKPESRLDPIVVTPEGLAGDGTLCYTIRSYVVARDSKNSDSVHPVGYSTCQPASRYRLKSAEMRVSGR